MLNQKSNVAYIGTQCIQFSIFERNFTASEDLGRMFLEGLNKFGIDIYETSCKSLEGGVTTDGIVYWKVFIPINSFPESITGLGPFLLDIDVYCKVLCDYLKWFFKKEVEGYAYCSKKLNLDCTPTYHKFRERKLQKAKGQAIQLLRSAVFWDSSRKESENKADELPKVLEQEKIIKKLRGTIIEEKNRNVSLKRYNTQLKNKLEEKNEQFYRDKRENEHKHWTNADDYALFEAVTLKKAWDINRAAKEFKRTPYAIYKRIEKICPDEGKTWMREYEQTHPTKIWQEKKK